MDANKLNYTKAEVEKIVKDERKKAFTNCFVTYTIVGVLCIFLGPAYSLVAHDTTTNGERYANCMAGNMAAVVTPLLLSILFSCVCYCYISCVNCTVENVPALKNLAARRLYNYGASATESDIV